MVCVQKMNSQMSKAFSLNFLDGNRSPFSFYKYFCIPPMGKTSCWAQETERQSRSSVPILKDPQFRGETTHEEVFDKLSAEGSNRRPEEVAQR